MLLLLTTTPMKMTTTRKSTRRMRRRRMKTKGTIAACAADAAVVALDERCVDWVDDHRRRWAEPSLTATESCRSMMMSSMS
jgi:hypothetical protein